MKSPRPLLPALACAIALSACQPTGGIATTALEQAKQGIEQANQDMAEAQKEIDEARNKLAKENLSIDHGHKGNGNLPKGEITPSGELLIDGKAVPTTPEQKQLVLAYRGQLIDVAGDGMAIGIEGAKLGMNAAGSALGSLLGGKSDEDIGKEAERMATETIKPQVEKLCARLPELLKSQQALATALPAFQPYADMTQSDVDDCMDKSDFDF